MFDNHWAQNQSSNGLRMGAARVARHQSGMNGLLSWARRRVPVREICLFLLAVVAFKVFLFLELGAATYGYKMDALAEGNFLERVAAHTMTMDPVSKWAVDGIRFGTW